MGDCWNLDHLAGSDHCRGLSRRTAGRRTHHRSGADHGNGRPTGCSIPTTKIRPPSSGWRRARVHGPGLLPPVGQVPSAALAIAAADYDVLRDGHQAHTLGGDVVAVWRQQAQRAGHRGLLELARAWQISTETGAPMSSTLEQVATSLSSDEELSRVVNSELAAARATSKVMAALPPCGIGIGYLLGGDPARWLLAGPAGWVCLLTGILLACAGVLWIEALARRATAEG
jgi:hypothetical protein